MARSELSILVKVVDKASKDLKSIDKALVGVGAAMGAAVAAGVALKAAIDFGKQGAEMTRLADAGDKMAGSFGQSMDDIVSAMSKASNRTVDTFALIGAANKALQLGVAQTPEEFEKLTAASIALGRAMGRGPMDAINDITTGIGRLSPLILDNLGILTKDMPEGLSDLEKKQFLYNKTLEAAAPLLDENGQLSRDTATAYEQMEVQSTELKVAWQQLTSEALLPLVTMMGDALGESNEFRESFKRWRGVINRTEMRTEEFVKKLGELDAESARLTGLAGYYQNIADAAWDAAAASSSIVIPDSLRGRGFGARTRAQNRAGNINRTGVGKQHGGTFTVPGGFPGDSFPMGVSSGEQVSVSNRDERSFFSGSNVNINNGTDLEGFEALLRQVQ